MSGGAVLSTPSALRPLRLEEERGNPALSGKGRGMGGVILKESSWTTEESFDYEFIQYDQYDTIKRILRPDKSRLRMTVQ